MKIDLNQDATTIDAFDLVPAQVIKLMREGAMTSQYETDIDADARSHRLAF